MEAQDFVFHACTRDDGLGIDLARDPLGPILAQAIAEVTGSAGGTPSADASPASNPSKNPAPTPAPASGATLADLAGLWFPLRDGRHPNLLTPDEIALTCHETPARIHPDGFIAAFGMVEGALAMDSHMRCDATLACDFARGAPSQGRPIQGRATLVPEDANTINACLNGTCLYLGRCPDPEWSARERASGLAATWEEATRQRD